MRAAPVRRDLATAVRRAVQTARIAPTVRPAHRFVADVALDRELGRYRSRRTGFTVQMRPRADLQVAREALSKEAYPPPEAVRAALAGSSPRILDLGANIGLAALSMLRTYGPGTRVIALEPDPQNLEDLRANVELNGLADAIDVRWAAAGTSEGRARLTAGRRHMSRVALADDPGDEAVDVPVIDVFEVGRDCDLWKVDVEGAEWPILHDPRLASLGVRALSLEWHGGRDPARDAEGEARELLTRAGFVVRTGRRLGHVVGDLWAWRPG